MNCQKSRSAIIEWARSAPASVNRSPELSYHMETCANCSTFLQTQSALSAALACLAREADNAVPPESLESGLLAEFGADPKTARKWVPAWTVVAAACVAAGAILFREPPPASRSLDRPFFLVPYTAPPAPYERTRVVRMEVPVAALIAAGFEIHVPDPGTTVQAEVLLGQDGRTVAVRIVPDLDRRINQ
jgi:hypothetical protein